MDLTSAWCKIETSIESLAPLIHQVSMASPEDYPEKAEKIRKGKTQLFTFHQRISFTGFSASQEIISLCKLAKELSKTASTKLQHPTKSSEDVSGEVDLTQDDT